MDHIKNDAIPHLEIEIKENEIQIGAMELLRIIRPNWEETSIRFKLLTDGITNKLVACRPEGASEAETVLVRVYGNKTDLIIDRKAETRNIILLNKAGIAPNLYATFKNGLAYRYLPGRTLTCETVRDPEIYRLVARQMAQLHKIKPDFPHDSKPFIWEKVRKFLDLVPEVFCDPEKHRRYLQNVTQKSKIDEELLQLRTHLEELSSPIVFAHNDLLLGNVIYNEPESKVTFIDYEYAALNYQAFDIANHFAEFVGLGEIDYSLYPNKELQESWIHTYLTEFNGREPSAKEIQEIYVQVCKFVLLSHLFWGVWALVQAEHSYINFDYMGYAAIRINEYFSKKEIFLSLNLTS